MITKRQLLNPVCKSRGLLLQQPNITTRRNYCNRYCSSNSTTLFANRVAQPSLCWFSNSTTSSSSKSDTEKVTRQQVLDEAAAMTKSLYRLCLRSTKVIRTANAFDEKEFQKREEEYANPDKFSASGGGGIMSMAPPPDREDELRSRAEYYQAYAREYFTQESDCLQEDPLSESDIRRYLYYLRKGEKDRKWLLGDMMFKDPYKGVFDLERVDAFETMAMKHLGLYQEKEKEQAMDNDDEDNDDDDDDGYFTDEEHSNPEWFQKKYPHLK